MQVMSVSLESLKRPRNWVEPSAVNIASIVSSSEIG